MEVIYPSGNTRITPSSIEELKSLAIRLGLNVELKCNYDNDNSVYRVYLSLTDGKGNVLMCERINDRNLSYVKMDPNTITTTIHAPHKLYRFLDGIFDLSAQQLTKRVLDEAKRITGFGVRNDPMDELLEWYELVKSVEKRYEEIGEVKEICGRVMEYVRCVYNEASEGFRNLLMDSLEECKKTIRESCVEWNRKLTETARREIKTISEAQCRIEDRKPVGEKLMKKLKKLQEEGKCKIPIENLEKYNIISELFCAR